MDCLQMERTVIKEIMKLKTFGSEESNMAILLAIHCAPILKGVKVANIMTVTKRESAQIALLLQETAISSCVLETGGDKEILYLYREKELIRYLERREIKDFLSGFGYPKTDLKGKLNRLSKRVSLYSDGTIGFPHEIGVFLGYPLMDVKGFIENEGKNYEYLGYWKVYHNVQGAIRLFRIYDEERKRAVKEVVLGKTIREIAV